MELKLTQDQQDLILQWIDNPDAVKLFANIIDSYVSTYEENALKVNLVDEGSEKELIYRKLKAEGAAKIVADIKRLVRSK